MTEAFIYDSIRTPRGRGKKTGSLYEVKPVSLVAGLIRAVLERNPHATIGTDDAVSLAGTTKDYGSELVDWYNDSWYGEVGPYAPYNAYVAPPLDAVWATAPYLHNGSVPDVATLLDSTKRPKYWRRVDHDTTHYDQNALGFPWQALASGQNLPPFGVAAKDIYDAGQYSHANRGHTLGDALTAEERRAVIEYLKAL